jgi:uncharacterized protein YdaU (DUF1376 family)
MAELPIMPLKTDALVADTQHMSAEEFGAYCRLLFAMWRHGGRLPNNPGELAHIAGVTARRWSAIADCVLRPMIVTDVSLSQKRLSDTWIGIQRIRAKRVVSAGKRWSKRNAGVMQVHMQNASTWNANQISKKDTSLTTSEQGAEKGLGEEEKREPKKAALEASPILAATIRAKGWG